MMTDLVLIMTQSRINNLIIYYNIKYNIIPRNEYNNMSMKNCFDHLIFTHCLYMNMLSAVSVMVT